FKYLDIPFSGHGIDRPAVFTRSQQTDSATMRMLETLGTHMYAFGLPADIRGYLIFVRSILEYGLEIVSAGRVDPTPLKKAQNACLRTSICYVVYIAVLVVLPNIYTWLQALQTKFLRRTLTLRPDSLPKALTMQLDITKAKTEWEKICHSVLWKHVQHLERR
ncbi:hypothetical protein CLU79DRAFT_678676, partial [Phycomyces nitens]